MKGEAIPSVKPQKLQVVVNKLHVAKKKLRGSRKRLREDGGGDDVEKVSSAFKESLLQDTVISCEAILAHEGCEYLCKGGPGYMENEHAENKVLNGLFDKVAELIAFVG